jgi:hypothetical protein
MKKAILFGLLFLTGATLYFLFLAYFGQNWLSLMLNQGTSAPAGLQDISITKRRGLKIFFMVWIHTVRRRALLPVKIGRIG